MAGNGDHVHGEWVYFFSPDYKYTTATVKQSQKICEISHLQTTANDENMSLLILFSFNSIFAVLMRSIK